MTRPTRNKQPREEQPEDSEGTQSMTNGENHIDNTHEILTNLTNLFAQALKGTIPQQANDHQGTGGNGVLT